MGYTVHTLDTAPADAKDTLAGVTKAYGFLQNLMGVMAEAPALVKAYRTLVGLFDETSLTPSERQIVLLTVSSENECEYCVAAHSVIAAMQMVPADVVQAIREGRPITDTKLEALRRFTASVVSTRARVPEAEMSAFLNAGYGKQQVLEVVLGVGVKTLSNYTNHLGETPLDAAFAKAAWSSAA